MKLRISCACLLLGWSLIQVTNGEEATIMQMDDGTVQGEQLREYEASWLQCGLQQDGQWNAVPLTETLVVIGDMIRVTQRSERSNGIVTVSTTYLERSSLSPLRMEQESTAADGTEKGRMIQTLTDQGYSGKMVRGDQHRELSGAINTSMWDGAMLGLPLATIDPTRYPVEFTSSMMSMNGTYRTIATVAGRTTLHHQGIAVDALLVDVEWHHIESGDIYPPGPDASGGRYWIVPEPPANFPYVPQYQTDSYLVSSLVDTCPESDVVDGDAQDDE